MKFYRRHFLKFDLVLGGIAAAAVGGWGRWLNGAHTADEALLANRPILYGTIATVLGSLLGFAIATVAIFLAAIGSDRLDRVRASSQMSTVWGTFTSTIRWLAARTLVGLVLLMLDRDNAPNRPLELLGIGIWVVAIFRLIWAIWILEQLVALLAPTARKSDTGSDRD